MLPEIITHIGGAIPGAIEIGHETNDSWETPAFVDAVRASGRRQLVFAGIATDTGVALTAISALRAGYQVAVLVDVCGTVNRRAEQAALSRLTQAGAILTAWSAFAGEVQRNYPQGKGPEVLEVVARRIFQGTRMTESVEES